MIKFDEIKNLEQKLLSKQPLPSHTQAKIIGDAELSGAAWTDEREPKRKAAVLIPMINRAEGISILLTKRTANLPSHAGQVAFPGGKVEPHDQTIIHTALRETNEEVGLAQEHVTVLGVLQNYYTATGFEVAPVVGLLADGFTIKADESEVEQVFEVPLSFVLNKNNHILQSRFYKGADRKFYSMDYAGHTIWGATAAILVNLCHVLVQYVEEEAN